METRLHHREQIWQLRAQEGLVAAASDAGRAADDALVVFIHLAKTGGVTMSKILLDNIGPDEFLQIDDTQTDRSALGTWSPAALVRSFEKMPADSARRVKYIWGHFGADIAASLPRPGRFFTMLRDPIDRIVSGFYYATGGQMVDNDGKIITLEDYANRKRDYDLGIDNYMTRVLSGDPILDPPPNASTTANSWLVADINYDAAVRTLDSYFLVGLLEKFDETLVLLASQLRWSLADVVYQVQNVTLERPRVTDIPRALQDSIHEWNGFDAMLFAHAGRLLAHQIKAYPGNFERDLSVFRELNELYRNGMPPEELEKQELQSASLRH